jgi:predicted nuclease of restriction endonuclease-like (RecB) superfamily
MTDRPASLTPDLPQHLLTALRELIAQGRQRALRAVDMVQVQTCWEVGRHIVEFEQGGENRAAYGKRLLVQLGQALTQEFGKGFDATNLRHMRAFYLSFPKCDALRRELSWTHYRLLLRVEHPSARDWYMHEAAGQNWSTRALERQIGTLYYERLLESSLEQALMDKLQHFLLELGKGFAFVARQQRISTETQDFYIDLVFYNYLLKCFVLIDLKTGHLTHQDIGQMDMYVRMYDDLRRNEGDNPTVGILLCGGKDQSVVRYSVLHESEQMFASKYRLILPSEEELRREIEREQASVEAQRLDSQPPES